MNAINDSAAGLAKARASLGVLEDDFGRFTSTTEQDFLKIGKALADSVNVFGRLGDGFTDLAERLHSDDAGNAIQALEKATEGIRRMPSGDQQVGVLLGRLEDNAGETAKRLDTLRKIIGEIGALAINGKIQAAQVTAADVDFSVFTTEIGRLGHLAERSVEQAGTRLESVQTAVRSAQVAAEEFARSEAKELESVRQRIDGSLAVLADRRRRAAAAAESVAVRSNRIAQRINSTVGELQINDNVCQRIEHLRSALRAVRSLSDGRAVTEPKCDSLNSVPPERRAAVVSGVCRLVGAQLAAAAQDYQRDVASLVDNLSTLATDAAGILGEAESAFNAGESGIFISEVRRDVERASELLATYAEERDRTRSVEKAVSESFRAMASDLESIRSIDADMRIMGLNATLKCGRLGGDGRALGVVAHELRACSKRTEDSTNVIARLLDETLALSEALTAATEQAANEQAAAPMETIADSMSALTSLGDAMTRALSRLRTDAGGVTSSLTMAAKGIDTHERLERLVADRTAPLADVAETLASVMAIDAAAHNDIYRMMVSHYTMDRERAVHQTFAGRHLTVAMSPSGGDTGSVFF